MKKILVFMLSIICLVSLAACNNTKTEEKDDPDYIITDITQGSQKYIQSLEVDTTNAKIDYYLTENFSSDGVKVTALYNDETKEDVTSKVTFDDSDFNSDKEGVYSIKIIYDDKTQQLYSTYTVSVKNMVDLITTPDANGFLYVVGLKINLNGVKTEYRYNETNFDFSNLPLSLDMKRENGTVVTVANYTPQTDPNFSVDTSKVDTQKPGLYQVEVSYTKSYLASNGLTQVIKVSSSFEIKIINPLVNIEFISGNLELDQYASLDISDWQVKANYESGFSQIVDPLNLEVTYDNYTVGSQDATISYTEDGISKETVVKIMVLAAELDFEELFFTANSLTLANSILTDTLWYDEDSNAGNMIYFTPGAKVTTNSKQLDGYSFTQRLQLQGDSSLVLNLAMLKDKNLTITVYAMSGNSGESRGLSLYDDSFETGTLIDTHLFGGKALEKYSFTIVSDGGTYIIHDDSSGVNVYGVLITIGE